MFQNFYPNKLIRSVYELNWEELSRTYGGVIFDIDNTLVPHGAAADEAAIQLFARIHNLGMKTMLVSNNGEARVKPFAQQVQTDYIYKAGKPKVVGYNKAMAKMGTDPKHTLFIGDQIYSHYHPNMGRGITDYERTGAAAEILEEHKIPGIDAEISVDNSARPC